MQYFKFMNWWIGEFVVSFFDVTNRLYVGKTLPSLFLPGILNSKQMRKIFPLPKVEEILVAGIWGFGIWSWYLLFPLVTWYTSLVKYLTQITNLFLCSIARVHPDSTVTPKRVVIWRKILMQISDLSETLCLPFPVAKLRAKTKS